MSLNEGDLEFLRVSESKSPDDLRKLPMSVGRLQAMLTRSDPDEARRIRAVLDLNPLPEHNDKPDPDDKYERGAELGKAFNVDARAQID